MIWPRLIRLPQAGTLLEWEKCAASQVLGYLRGVDDPVVWISHIGVDPVARGQGWGSRLLQEALQYSGGGPSR